MKQNLCYFCNKNHQRPNVLEDHIRSSHTKEQPFQCIKCSKQFSTKISYRSHNVKCHMKILLKCPHCREVFPHKSHLRLHLLHAHKNLIKLYPCSKCGKEFFSKSDLNHHTVIHTYRKKDVFCSTCGKGFHNKYILTQHFKNSHTSLKTNKTCYFCAKTYLGIPISSLYNHIRIHTGEKLLQNTLYHCTFCPATYPKLPSLNTHIRSKHTLERDYPCTLCDKWFLAKANMEIHVQQVHSTDGPLKCPYCPKRFKIKGPLTQHIRVFHKELKDYECKCGKKFGRSFGLKMHVPLCQNATKTIPCPNCKKMFPTKAHLKNHLRSHNSSREKNLSCYFCKRRFWQRGDYWSHLWFHTMEKFYKCKAKATVGNKTCSFETNRPSQLQKHNKVEHEGHRFRCPFCPTELKSWSWIQQSCKQISHWNLVGNIPTQIEQIYYEQHYIATRDLGWNLSR